jgi:hypothetical protein
VESTAILKEPAVAGRKLRTLFITIRMTDIPYLKSTEKWGKVSRSRGQTRLRPVASESPIRLLEPSCSKRIDGRLASISLSASV